MATLSAEQQIEFFRSIPWCAAHLSSPSLVIRESVSHRRKRGHLDSLISQTLNRPDALPAYITFYHVPPASSPSPPATAESAPSSHAPPPPQQQNQQRQQEQQQEQEQPRTAEPAPAPAPAPAPEPPAPATGAEAAAGPLITEVRALVALGPMLNGWEGVCHGGMVVTLLDEVMGQVFAANRAHGRLPPDAPATMTAYLNTRFERPVRTGASPPAAAAAAVVLVSARLRRRDRRKFWLDADVTGPAGEVLARAEAMFIMLRSKL
ncbi:hypothetical protein VTH06DRAFT_4562 [Thermothelomyces fergusii]